MGLDFGKPIQQQNVIPTTANEIEEVESYDIVADREQMNTQLVGSQEVDALVSTIEVHNLDTIVSFGAEACLLYTSRGRRSGVFGEDRK